MLVATFASSPVEAVPAPNKTHTLEQPNDVTFEARQFGDECYHGWETKAGYTIEQNESGYWLYLTNESGDIVRSNRAVGIDSRPQDLPKRLRRTPATRCARGGGVAGTPLGTDTEQPGGSDGELADVLSSIIDYLRRLTRF
jgi:hypothetical protein